MNSLKDVHIGTSGLLKSFSRLRVLKTPGLRNALVGLVAGTLLAIVGLEEHDILPYLENRLKTPVYSGIG